MSAPKMIRRETTQPKKMPRYGAWFRLWSLFAVLLFLAAVPVFAAEENAPDPADTPAGLIFRWLNFVLVMGGIAYLIGKFGAPYFRSHGQSISNAIREASEARAAAERELREIDERVAALNLEIQDLRRAGARESTAEAERLRELTSAEEQRILKAAQAEIEASERAGLQELRGIAARLATERAAELLRTRVNRDEDASLFRSFVAQLERRTS
jgi:F0F1-type ATP synthase membrane subunit b/b'